MKRTAVYRARCEAFALVCYAADLGAIPWRLANNMHMLKEPWEAPHLAPATRQERGQHRHIATRSRNAAARVLRQMRRSFRGAPSGMRLSAVRMLGGKAVNCYVTK